MPTSRVSAPGTPRRLLHREAAQHAHRDIHLRCHHARQQAGLGRERRTLRDVRAVVTGKVRKPFEVRLTRTTRVGRGQPGTRPQVGPAARLAVRYDGRTDGLHAHNGIPHSAIPRRG
jgi:hypothetical protein